MDETKKNSILIVDDEKTNILALTHILSEEYTVFAAKDGAHAIKAAETYIPSLVLLDVLMPEMDGYAVLTKLKSNEKTQNIPIIFITGLVGDEEEEKALALGAADYISKPFNPATVRLRVRNQIQILNQISTIEQLTIIDPLTGILNRRGFDNRAEMEWNRAIRGYTPISVLLMDIDDFKGYNDKYGHLHGDTALTTVSTVIQQTLGRPSDFASRWGGDEFIAFLPNTDEAGAMNVAERIRTNIEAAEILYGSSPTSGITVSIGVNSHIPVKGSSLEDFIASADEALYNAKEAGRNRICPAG